MNITHLPLDQQWLRDTLNGGGLFTEFEETIGALEANQVRKKVLSRLADEVEICRRLGLDPAVLVPATRILAKDRVWEVVRFEVAEPEPVVEAGCQVFWASLLSARTCETIDFRLVSR